jgi:hypothetical protein
MNINNGCWVCGKHPTERHHVYFGSGNRKLSEKYGLVVNLCADHHRGQPNGVHGGNKELDLEIKRHFQREFEKEYLRIDFIKIFGRNYLD